MKVGQTKGYRSKAHSGRGRIMKVYTLKTGLWVTLFDTKRNSSVTVRPSQLTK